MELRFHTSGLLIQNTVVIILTLWVADTPSCLVASNFTLVCQAYQQLIDGIDVGVDNSKPRIWAYVVAKLVSLPAL